MPRGLRPFIRKTGLARAARQRPGLTATVRRKLATASTMPGRRLRLAATAWILLWPAKVVALTVPIRILRRWLGEDRALQGEPPALDPPDQTRAMELSAGMRLAVRYSPKSANCYPQALVAHVLLCRFKVDHALFFGVHRTAGNNALAAHAWVVAGDHIVCGGPDLSRYTVVRCFVTERR